MIEDTDGRHSENEITYHIKPGDWLESKSNPGRVGKVKAVHHDELGYSADIWLYDHSGNRLPRQSPAMGGPRSFEPCCDISDWQRISKPSFPITLRWKDVGHKRVALYDSGAIHLPALSWKPRVRKRLAQVTTYHDPYEEALKAIAAGHNDARALAKKTLGIS